MVVVLWVVLAGCDHEGPRRLDFPVFDATAPFPELHPSESSGSSTQGGGGAGQSDYEKAIAESMGEGEQGEEDGRPATVKRQTVPLAGTFVSSIPLDFDEWQWSTDGRVTLIAHRRAGAARPDALIYAEAYSPLTRNFPSVEVRRFQQTVDPALVGPLMMPGLSDLVMQKLSEQTQIPVDPLGQAVTRGISHTMGLGLNYTSSEDSFTGWQWVGHNDARVELRLGRTRGKWADAPSPDVGASGMLSQVAQQVDGFGEIQRQFQEAATRQPARQKAASSAWMVLGSATVERDTGAHIAILCKTAPRCPVASELAEFLAALEPGTPGELANLQDQSDAPALEAFAHEQGIPFLPGDQMIEPGKLEEILRQGLNQ